MKTLAIRASKLAAIGAVSVLALSLAAPVFAAQSSESLEVNIEAQPLRSALRQLANRYRATLIAPGDLTAGQMAPSVKGTLSADDAFARLLSGTGLIARRSERGAIIIEQPSPETNEEGTENEREPEIQEIIFVTGTKRNLSLQETQTSVELFDMERLEREALFSLDEILLRTPNVSAINVQTSFSIRGIGQSGVGFAGTGRTSNVYVDGAPLTVNGQQGAQSLWDIGQVEVLRGPQSTIQGRNALAGAIVMQTNDPTYDWEFRARGQIASQETGRASAVISGPIVEDQIAFRFAFDYQTYDADVVEVTTGLPQEFQDSYTYRAKLLIEPEGLEGFRAEFKAERIETDFGEFNTRFAPVSFEDPAFSEFDPFGQETFTRVRLEDITTDLLVADVSQEIGDSWRLIAIGAYEESLRETRFCQPSPTGECRLSDGTTETQQYSAELRAEFDYGKLSGWVGGYYFNDDQVNQNEFAFAVAAFGLPVTPAESELIVSSIQGEKVDNYALFADVTYEFNEKWSLNLGARYDWEDFVDTGTVGSVASDPESCTVAFPFGALPCTAIFPVNNNPPRPTSFNAFLPRGALTYNFDDLRSLSFIVQRGYRAGGSVFQVLPGSTTNVPFDPEFVTNFELAFRSQWLDRRLTVNANAFYIDWTDQQVGIPGPSGNPLSNDGFIDNVGESRVYGLELSASYKASESLDVYGSMGVLDAEFTDFEFVPSAPDNPFNNLAGNTFPAAPSFTASAGVNYEHESGVYTSLTASYQSERESDVTNLDINRVGDYVLMNARLGYQFDWANVYLFANNLFNERFSTRNEFAGINVATGALDVRPNARFQINEPRIVGLSVEVAF